MKNAGDLGVVIFQAGTKTENGRLVSAGGRVLSVTAVGVDLSAARDLAYRGVDAIGLAGSIHRGDIALVAANDSLSKG